MGGNVPAAAFMGVIVQPVEQALQRNGQSGQATLQLLLGLLVEHHDPNQCRQVAAVPETIHIALTGSDGAAEGNPTVKVRMLHPHRGA